jgi:hypothetical protein
MFFFSFWSQQRGVNCEGDGHMINCLDLRHPCVRGDGWV